MLRRFFAAVVAVLAICGVAAAQISSNGPMVPSGAPFNGFATLAKSGTAASVTGTTTETILATIAVPGSTLGPNGQLQIRTYWTVPNNADTKTLKVRLGTSGITSALVSNTVVTTFANPMITVDVQNLNATNSQNAFSEGSRGTDGIVTTFLLTSAVDMTANENIYITGMLGTTTDTITLAGYSVQAAF